MHTRDRMSSPVEWSNAPWDSLLLDRSFQPLSSALLPPDPDRSSSASKVLCTRCAGRLERGFAIATRGLWLLQLRFQAQQLDLADRGLRARSRRTSGPPLESASLQHAACLAQGPTVIYPYVGRK